LLKALAELVKATSLSGRSDDAILSPEFLKAIAELIGAVAWPIAVVTAILVFKNQIGRFLGDVSAIEAFGAKISRKITGQLKISAQEAAAIAGKSTAPTQGEIARSVLIESLVSDSDLSVVRKQGETLAAEYERVRASMLPGDERTRRMEVVVAKMRTIGRAIFPLRHEFASSPSPGMRLVAISALQVEPDYEMLDWLAERLGTERPFVGYHALVALLVAIRSPGSSAHVTAIERATQIAQRNRGSIGDDADRARILTEIETTTRALRR
jgi:hypothetical protein